MSCVECCAPAIDLDQMLESVRIQGYAVLPGFLDDDFIHESRAALYDAWDACRQHVGAERLARSGERGVVRLPMQFSAHFFRFLEIPEILEILDRTVGPT